MDFEEQGQEIKTIKKRTFQLELSDEDVGRIYEKAASVGITPEAILENFVSDLVDGTCCLMIDDHKAANQWFENSGYHSRQQNSMLMYFMEDSAKENIVELENFLDLNNKIKEHRKALENLQSDNGEWKIGLTADERLEAIAYLSEKLSEKQKEVDKIWNRYLAWAERHVIKGAEGEADIISGTIKEEINKIEDWYAARVKAMTDGEKTRGEEEEPNMVREKICWQL